MSVIKGFGGAVDGVDTVRNWKIASSQDLQRYVASNTKGGSARLAGNGDWNGTYDSYGFLPDKMPGDSFTFGGSLDGTNGVTGEAMVKEVVIVVDVEAGTIISHVATFESNGALTLGAVAATDVTVPSPPSSIGCKLELSEVLATPSFSEVNDVRTMTLTITRSNAPYVSSSTAGGTKRVAGNWDFTFNYTVYEGDPANLIAAGAIKHVKMFVTNTLFWELKWVRYADVSDVECDIEGEGLVGATQNTSMHGYTDVATTPTEGYIKTPATSPATIWPVP